MLKHEIYLNYICDCDYDFEEREEKIIRKHERNTIQ